MSHVDIMTKGIKARTSRNSLEGSLPCHEPLKPGEDNTCTYMSYHNIMISKPDVHIWSDVTITQQCATVWGTSCPSTWQCPHETRSMSTWFSSLVWKNHSLQHGACSEPLCAPNTEPLWAFQPTIHQFTTVGSKLVPSWDKNIAGFSWPEARTEVGLSYSACRW